MRYIIFILLFILLLFILYKSYFEKYEENEEDVEDVENSQVAIVSTVKKPHQFNDWIKYHLKIGFAKLYIILDDENEDIIYPDKRVVFIKNNSEWKDKLSKLNMKMFIDNYDKEVMSRQILNVMYISNILKMKSKIKWLLHIDADELFYPGENKLSKIFNNNYDSIRFENLEMMPMEDNYNNCFRQGTYFKMNKMLYVAYTNGKSAVNLNSNAIISGVHGFLGGSTYDSPDGKILHYPSCNFDEYVNKYKILGKFSDKWWDEIDIPIVFHTESRDIIGSCTEENDDVCMKKVRKYYNTKNVYNDKIDSDDLIIIDYVNEVL